MLQLLLALRLLPWVMKQPFAASYWAFSFGLTALATDLIRMVDRGEQGILSTLAMPLLWLVTAAIALLAAGTIVLLFRGKLFPLARAL
jgi:tellurite resistance protein